MLSKRSQSLIEAHKRKKWGFIKGQGFWLGKKMSREHRRKIGLANKGKLISEEQRKKISNALKGHIKSDEHRKKLSNSLKGKKISEEARKNMRLAHAKRKMGYTRWKRAVMERGGYKCQKCGFDDKRALHVDHIKPVSLYPELRFDVNNGQTLCANCHTIKTFENGEWNKNVKK